MSDNNHGQNRTVTKDDIINALLEKHTEAKINEAKHDPEKLMEISKRLLQENSKLKERVSQLENGLTDNGKPQRMPLEQRIAAAQNNRASHSQDVKAPVKSIKVPER